MAQEPKQKREPNRIINLERTSPQRRRVYVPLVRRKRRFLEVLEETGNVTMARAAAGLGKDRVYLARRQDAQFADEWAGALERFRARAEAEDLLPEEAVLETDGLVLRRGRGGRLQMAVRRPNGWSKAKEDMFFQRFLETGNISAASRAAGFSSKTAWERKRVHSSFRDRMEAAREEIYDRIEMMLIAQGSELLAGEDGAKPDPQIAMWLLKRRDQAAAGTLKPGRAGAVLLRERSFEEARDSILRKIEAIERHENRQRLAEGWIQDENDHWIPPGWVREAGPVPE
jgi:hypothetical protein